LMLDKIRSHPQILAAWEGGSAATGTRDQYSDIDLNILSELPPQEVLDLLEESLQPLGVMHTWQPSKPFWPGLMQRVIVLKDSPKHFSVDAGVFAHTATDLLRDFLEVERHGNQVVYFDKVGKINPGHTDPVALFKRQQERVEEIAQAFPIFKTLVLKEIDRGQAIDALAFYQNGLVRPLVEVLGMIHRPYKYDFNLRYLHKHFPPELQQLIMDLNFVGNFADLPAKILKADEAFAKATELVRTRTSL